MFNQKDTLKRPETSGDAGMLEKLQKAAKVGIKETKDKLNYEMDWDFITLMAERMSLNKDKYPPYNWKKDIPLEELKQAIFRHTIEIMKGNYRDENMGVGHLAALACNAMMLTYQLKIKG